MSDIAALRREIESLTERVAALEAGLGGEIDPLRNLGLTWSEARLLALLVRRKFVSREALWTALYGIREDTPASDNIMSVHICRLRKKLGLRIDNIRLGGGSDMTTGGYTLSPTDRAVLAARMKGFPTGDGGGSNANANADAMDRPAAAAVAG